jgi:hypothetical protein
MIVGCCCYTYELRRSINSKWQLLSSATITFSERYVPIKYKQDRHYTYQRNNEARSCNHCCSGKAISITYTERLSVAFAIKHAARMRHIVIWGPVRLYSIFPHYLINGIKKKKKKVINHKTCVFDCLIFYLKHFSF